MPTQQFGGSWTEEKLERVRRYLSAYATALKDQPFNKIYIDAFAGTGYREARDDEEPFPGLLDLKSVAKGSARIALEVEPSFDRYIFIEKKRGNYDKLIALANEFPHHADSISFVRGDANEELQAICQKTDWRANRAVLFLDAFGTQVAWQTLVLVAATKAIDVWILFPVGMGVDRLLPRHGKVPPEFQVALDRLLGAEDWRSAFYEISGPSPDLFGDAGPQTHRTANPMRIERYFLNRLATVFAGVAPKGLPLKNSRGYLMYLLCFACGNPRGKNIALRIANHLLRA